MFLAALCSLFSRFTSPANQSVIDLIQRHGNGSPKISRPDLPNSDDVLISAMGDVQ